MKKMFLVALSMLLMCMMVCTPYAAEAVQEITKYDTASLRDFPDLVNDGTIEEHKLLERRHDDEKEAMNMLAYRKESGENVAFLYHFDVKYKDKNGNIKDKSKEIVRDGLFSTTSFKTKDNDILSYFSVNDDGNVEVKTVYGEYSIVSVIENRNKGNRITAERDTEDTLTYRNAVDTGIHLMYEAEYNGVKEYIVLDANSGNKFTFTMDFVGLTPQLAADNSVLLLNADGETVLTIPPIYVEDSAVEKNSIYENSVKLTQVKENRYLLEIAVDEDFLSSAETVYPIYVDPYINLSNSNIEDTYVREGYKNRNYSSEATNMVGTTVLGNSIYTYIKFNNISNVCSYYNVLSSYYETFETTNKNETVLVEVLPASAAWDVDDLTWNNQPYYHEEIIAKEQVGMNNNAEAPYDYGTFGMYRFYISNLVRGWIQGLPNYGIVLRSGYDEKEIIELASANNTDYASKLVIVYIEDATNPLEGTLSVPNESNRFYIKNKRSGKYLTTSSTTGVGNVYQSNFTGESNQQWVLESCGTNSDYYTIRLYGTNLVLDVYCGSNTPSGNTNGANIQVHSSNGGTNQKWKFVRNWNGTYKILSNLSNDLKGVVVQNASISDGTSCILYTHNVNFTYNDDWTIEPVTLNKAYFYGFSNKNNAYSLNTETTVRTAAGAATSIGFSEINIKIDISASTAKSDMLSANLWYFHGHGLRGGSGLSFLYYIGETAYRNYMLPNDSSASWIIKANSLRNMYLWGTNACNTGDSKSINNGTDKTDMIGMVYRRGAHFVFSTPPISHASPNADWQICFMESLKNGMSYYDAIQEADSYVIEVATSDETYTLYQAMRSCSRHYAGDSSIVLHHTS